MTKNNFIFDLINFMGDRMLRYNMEQENTTILNPVNAETLTAYDEEFLITHVKEGQDVLIV